jgi:uncharacterized protein
MNKRLRKKKRVGEFQELGIEVSCVVSLGSKSLEFDVWCDDFVLMIESLSLICGGGGESDTWSVFVCKNKGSVTEENRQSISNWLSENKHVENFEVSGFFDVWHK